jgi:hypothetical protein
MSKEAIELNEAGEDVLSTLTAREAEVLRQRFGIDLEVTDKEKRVEGFSYVPPSGNNGGQGGAPQVAIEPAPSLQDKKYNQPSKAPRITKH